MGRSRRARSRPSLTFLVIKIIHEVSANKLGTGPSNQRRHCRMGYKEVVLSLFYIVLLNLHYLSYSV